MSILLFSIMIGVALTLFVWSGYQFVTIVPDEDRSYLDRPPIGFRLVWPLIKLIVHYLGPTLSTRFRLNTQAKLRKAGVDYTLSAEQFFAGRVIAALITALLAMLVATLLDIPTTWRSLLLCAMAGGLGSFYPEIWLKEVTQRREREIFKTLPFFLDIITLSVEAGTNLTGAFTQAVQKSPEGPLKSEIGRVLRDVRAGKSRADAMRAMADRVQMSSVTSFISSVIQAERMGSSLGPVLRAQADQRRTERFLKAEKLAMEAPVKLLGPLIMFIFPTTFIVLGFVLLYKAAEAGVVTWRPLLWAMTWPG